MGGLKCIQLLVGLKLLAKMQVYRGLQGSLPTNIKLSVLHILVYSVF